MARERGLTVDTEGFETLMEEQRERARRAQKKSVIEVTDTAGHSPTHFLGYEHDHTGADVEAIFDVGEKKGVVLNNPVLYAEMGGQVGDQGEMIGENGSWKIEDTRKSGDTSIHLIAGQSTPAIGEHVTVRLDRTRRATIERHHTVTHLLHWALHEVVSSDATQKGSYVGPEKLTFDFSSAALTKQQVREVEKLVNEQIAENAPVSWTEIPYPEAKAARRYHAILRRQIRRPCARSADRRIAERIEWLLDGTLRRHPRAGDRRHRFLSNRERRSDRGRHSSD